MKPNIIKPDWPAPSHIVAGVTLRDKGVSKAPYSYNNLATHVGDDEIAVVNNRAALDASLIGKKQWQWLDQVHGVTVVNAPTGNIAIADASFTQEANVVCAVLTADCLPILLCDKQGVQVAAIHAGWRSLCGGIIEKTIQQFSRTQDVMAWLGPAIGPQAFEVGTDVLAAFEAAQCGDMAHTAFTAKADNKYWANIYALAKMRLAYAGVRHIYGGNFCTVTESDRFYSYRRDGITGRMASFIYKRS